MIEQSSMNRERVRQIADAVRAALEPVAEEFNLDVKVGGGSFDPDIGMFRPKVEFTVIDKAQREWDIVAPLYSFEADDFGKTFTMQGRTFVLSGIAPKSPKRPVLATEEGTDRTFKFTVESVKRALA